MSIVQKMSKKIISNKSKEAPSPNTSLSRDIKMYQPNKEMHDTHRATLAKVFRLNIDCFDEVFDYLSIADLSLLGQTCDRMHKICANYFHENCSAFELQAKYNGMYLDCCKNGCKVNGIEKFVEKLSIRTNGIINFQNAAKTFRYIETIGNKTLRKLQFSFIQLTGRDIECIKDILSNIETVVIEQCKMNEKFYEQFPEVCQNLRHLYVERFQCNRNVVKRNGNEWLLRSWPKLEHFGWTPTGDAQIIDELTIFFQLNSKLKSFSTDLRTLWTNRDAIMQSNVQLDELTVEVFGWQLPNGDFAQHFLNEMYDCGFFKRLHLHATFFDEAHDFEQVALTKGLEALRCPNLIDGLLLSKFIGLKELRIGLSSPVRNMDILAKCLVNLERLHIRYAAMDDFLPFICHSPKLKFIKIDAVKDLTDFNSKLDLNAMERERMKLTWARKVRIYIDECVYLATKWAYGMHEFSLVEIKRAHSNEWSNHFEYY